MQTLTILQPLQVRRYTLTHGLRFLKCVIYMWYQTPAHSKPSVINSMSKDSLGHEENIFKRFILYKIPLIISKYLGLAVHAGALWASLDSSQRWLWQMLRSYSDLHAVGISQAHPTGKEHRLYQNWRHSCYFALKTAAGHCCQPSSRGQARNCAF